MQAKDKTALSAVRLNHAEECLRAAKSLIVGESYKSAANRAYYCVFHAMRAVLALDGIDMKHHSGIISEFRRLYIKTGFLDVSLSETISLLSDMRTDSDYDDFFVISKSEAAEGVKDAEAFLSAVRSFLTENNHN
ncbi:MAG: HEPN domain-containing protein [Oscillospiraceae bacterium]|nr:HEPN domain-containing protein [Oscillospiraceae bacterium]MCD8343083.1 HEPN domain-containing protein [Oscillospiraceae bacterium]